MQGRTATFSTFSDAQFDEATFETQLSGDRLPLMILLPAAPSTWFHLQLSGPRHMMVIGAPDCRHDRHRRPGISWVQNAGIDFWPTTTPWTLLLNVD